MGVELEGIEETLFKLKRAAKRTNDAELAALRKHSKIMTQRAKDYAPVDKGNLEQAIQDLETREGTFNRRLEILIGVNPDLLGQGYFVYGERYDLIMHEGGYSLGPASQEKQRRTGKQVGAKFLTRAFDDILPDLMDEMNRIFERQMR